MKTVEIPAMQHVLDRIVSKVLDENASDLLGSPDHRVIARIAADQVREGVRLRKGRGQSVSGPLAEIDRMSRFDLEALCLERIHVVTH